ncbi:MAG: hypothetical protein ACM3YE_15235 [Bacteroidota bacterium]
MKYYLRFLSLFILPLIIIMVGCGGGGGNYDPGLSSPSPTPIVVTPTPSLDSSPSPTPTVTPTPSPDSSPNPSPGPSEFGFNLTYSGNNPFDANHPILLVIVDRTVSEPIGFVKATQNGTYIIDSTKLTAFHPNHSNALAILHDLDNNGFEGEDDYNDPFAYYYYNGSNNTSENINPVYSYTPISPGQTYTFTFSGGSSVGIIIY